MRARAAVVAIAALAVAAPLACLGPAPTGGGATSRAAVLAATFEVVVLPSFAEHVSRTADLVVAVEVLAAAPDAARLGAARSAWRAARLAWGRGEASLFGPPDDLRLAVEIDTSPIEPAKIELEIAGSATLDEAFIQAAGTTRKGYLAIEYFLFDPVGGDAAILDGLTIAADAARRRDYLRALARNADSVARRIRDSAGPGAAAFPTVNAGIDEIVNRMVFFAEQTADVRLGIPLGRRNGGVPQPALVESPRSGGSIDDVVADLEGLDALYRCRFDGRSGASLSALVAALAPDVDAAVKDALDRALADIRAIPGPLEAAVIQDRPAVDRALASIKLVKDTLAVDVVAVLSTTLTFSPFDGD